MKAHTAQRLVFWGCMDQRAHPCKKLRFEYIGQGESRKINGLCPPEHQRFRCVLSDFCYCILLKKHGFKSEPYISVRMRPLVRYGVLALSWGSAWYYW